MPKKATGKPFVKGDPRAGRPKGSRNKMTADIMTACQNVYHRLGGEEWLYGWVNKNARNEGAFAMLLLNKNLPSKVDVDHDGAIDITVRVKEANPSFLHSAWRSLHPKAR